MVGIRSAGGNRAAAPDGALGQAALFTGMLDSAPVRVWLLDAGHRVVWANVRAAALLGLPPEAVVGVGLDEVFDQPDADADAEARAAALAGRVASWSGWAEYRDGSRRYTERCFIPAEGQGGGRYFEFTIDQTELMEARERAEQAGRLLRDAVEALPDGLAIEGPDGRIVVCNEAYARVYDLPVSRLVGQTFAERSQLLGPRIVAVGSRTVAGDPEATDRELKLYRRTTEPVQVRALDGRDLLVRRAKTSEGGRIVVFSDLTAMRDSWDILSEVLEACPTPILVAGAADSVVRYANSAALGMIGPRGREGEDGAIIQWTREHEREGFTAALRREGKVEGFEARFRRPDGAELWLSIWARLASMRGETVVVATASNVTERRRAEDELRASWEYLRSVLEACPTPLTMARVSDAGIEYLNPAAREMMRIAPGTPSEASTLAHWREPQHRDAYLAALLRDGKVDGWEGVFRRGDGSEVELALYSRLADFRGVPVSVTTSMDLTELRAQAAEQTRQREALHQAEKMAAIGEMLAGIGHELNNPLSVLVGQAAILEETAPDEATRARAEKLSEAAARCARIVRSFLDIARQRRGEAGVVDLATLVREAVAQVEAEQGAGRVEFRLDLDPAARVAGNADQLRQVVANLLTNAVQALEGWAGERRVAARLSADQALGLVRLRVEDTGPGVAPEHAGRIFEPLFSTKAASGAGLGLALSQRIVSIHGGRIKLEREGPGAVFVVEFPMVREAARGAPARIATGRRRSVLLVDDDPAVLRTTADLLELHGHSVRCAGSVEHALAMLAEARPDVVFCDLHMPEQDGLDLLAAVEARWPELVARFAFATGRSVGSLARRDVSALGRPLLEKPFLPAEIEALIAELDTDGGARDD